MSATGSPAITLGLVALVAVAGCVTAPSPGARADFAAAVAATTTPAPRTDANSQIAHAELLRKARTGAIDVYFVGDSITRRWGALDYPQLLEHWNASFFGWNAANFGWGADRTQNILWRLRNGELDGVSPKIFVVQAGTNNLTDAAGPFLPESIAAGIEAVVAACLDAAPEALVILTAVFPRSDVSGHNAAIEAINRQLAGFANGRNVLFLDFNDQMLGADGRLLESMTVDGLHPSIAAYELWAQALMPIFTEALGPPAAADHAPPPTGNPAARIPDQR